MNDSIELLLFYRLSLFTLGSFNAAALRETYFIPNWGTIPLIYIAEFSSQFEFFFFFSIVYGDIFFSFFPFLSLAISPLVPPSHDTLSKMSAAKPGETCFRLAHMKDSVHVRDRLF